MSDVNPKAETELEIALRAEAERLEARLLALQPPERAGCPFCGHHNIQVMIEIAEGDEPLQPALPLIPGMRHVFPVTLMSCARCNYVMPFFKKPFTPSED